MDEMAIQSAHVGIVPRVGGLAIYLGLLGLIPLLYFGFVPLYVVFDWNSEDMALIILSAFPVFFVGTSEDLGYRMSPKVRLLASATSSLITLVIFKVWITKLGMQLLMAAFIAPVGILFAIFATGVINAFNIVDGLNGLSGYITLSTAITLSIVSFKVGNTQITVFLILLTAPILGFTFLNFPIGKIFLGDGGAYVLGHLLVWCAILLLAMEPEISSFAILLIFFWPVADTGLAIWRRWKLGNHADLPDRLHFHQLTMRYLEIRFFGRKGAT